MLIAVGVIVAVAILVDAVRTTVKLSEQRGPIARAVLRAGRVATGRLPRRPRAGAGIVLAFLVVLSWTLGLWLAWTIALSDPAITVIDTGTGEQVSGLDVVYVAGYAIFTLGTGDVVTTNAAGRLVSVLASGTGLFTVTLEVSYIVSLTSAAAHERRTARRTSAIGHDVERILRRAWRGASFTAIESLLIDLAADVVDLAEQRRTFPVLHDVLPARRALALGPSLLALGDALEVMRHGVAEEQAAGALAYSQMTEAIDALVQTLPADLDPRDPPAPGDATQVLESLGARALAPPPLDDERRARRRALLGLATEEGWQEAALDAVALPAA